MTSNVYDQHDSAFARVSAFVILDKTGERVATVALKSPADGAGRLYAYVHLIGTPMVRAWAGGGGYDKRSAAVKSAIGRFDVRDIVRDHGARSAGLLAHADAFRAAGLAMEGGGWERSIEKAGYRVLQAV